MTVLTTSPAIARIIGEGTVAHCKNCGRLNADGESIEDLVYLDRGMARVAADAHNLARSCDE